MTHVSAPRLKELSTAKVEEALSNLAKDGRIDIPDPRDVSDYLMQYPELIPIVERGCRSALRRFGEDTELSLERYYDPEIPDSYVALYARRDHYESSFLSVLDEIAEEYEDALQFTTGWFMVTTDVRARKSSHAI